jgi:ABC-type Fe3+-hydroxamate transport system substrate-binding protein
MLEALRPDVIITQDLCDVCSIDLATVRRVAAGMAGGREGGPEVVSLNPETIEGILDSILTVGRAIGRERSAIDAVVQLRERLFAAQEFVNPFADGPVVGFLEWTDPLYCAGHWNVQLIERAGGQHPWNATVPKENAGAAAGPMGAERVAGKSVRVPEELFVACKPEAVIIAPCGYSQVQAEFAARELAKKAWWGELPAVKKGRVAVMDGNAWFNRPGPRVVDAFEWMVEWLGRG